MKEEANLLLFGRTTDGKATLALLADGTTRRPSSMAGNQELGLHSTGLLPAADSAVDPGADSSAGKPEARAAGPLGTPHHRKSSLPTAGALGSVNENMDTTGNEGVGTAAVTTGRREQYQELKDLTVDEENLATGPSPNSQVSWSVPLVQ